MAEVTRKRKAESPPPVPLSLSEILEEQTAIRALADKCGLSTTTIRKALSQKPITWQTACRIGRALGIRAACFRIKEDNRGRNRGKKNPRSPGDA